LFPLLWEFCKDASKRIVYEDFIHGRNGQASAGVIHMGTHPPVYSVSKGGTKYLIIRSTTNVLKRWNHRHIYLKSEG
jgi:hypothetical protein